MCQIYLFHTARIPKLDPESQVPKKLTGANVVPRRKQQYFLLNQIFHDGASNQEKFLILLHAEDNTNQPNFLFRNYARFDSEFV